jgi:hypothetical protein
MVLTKGLIAASQMMLAVLVAAANGVSAAAGADHVLQAAKRFKAPSSFSSDNAKKDLLLRTVEAVLVQMEPFTPPQMCKEDWTGRVIDVADFEYQTSVFQPNMGVSSSPQLWYSPAPINLQWLAVSTAALVLYKGTRFADMVFGRMNRNPGEATTSLLHAVCSSTEEPWTALYNGLMNGATQAFPWPANGSARHKFVIATLQQLQWRVMGDAPVLRVRFCGDLPIVPPFRPAMFQMWWAANDLLNSMQPQYPNADGDFANITPAGYNLYAFLGGDTDGLLALYVKTANGKYFVHNGMLNHPFAGASRCCTAGELITNVLSRRHTGQDEDPVLFAFFYATPTVFAPKFSNRLEKAIGVANN